jgi:hypothetical protein
MLQSRPARIAAYVFIVATALAVIIPVNPVMPSRGLDRSWEFGMNEAVARHMNFGEQIVFTYGPYASIVTRMYQPDTSTRMMLGSIFLLVSYLGALLYLARGSKLAFALLLFVLFAAFGGGAELVLLTYALLLIACTVKYVSDNHTSLGARSCWLFRAAVLVLWATLGLLPLIKGSLILPWAAAVAVPPVLLAWRHQLKAAFALVAIPPVSTFLLWIVAHQSLTALPHYLRGALWLTSGYTQAMSTSWLILPAIVGEALVVLFLAAVLLICFSIARASVPGFFVKAVWGLTCLAFLLVIFKHGFVKADDIYGAFSSLAALALIAAMLATDRYIAWASALAIALTVATSAMHDPELAREVHEHFGPGVTWSGNRRDDIFAFCVKRAAPAYLHTTIGSGWQTYRNAWEGLLIHPERNDSLKERFDRAEDEIRTSYAMPHLTGTADIYTFEQAIVIVSGAQWDPRPVLQSYSVYTPELIRLNEQHLRGIDAPQWILFDLQVINGMLPSLDDGLSWPALLDNYSFVSYDGQFVLLQKRPTIKTTTTYDTILDTRCQTGSSVLVPPGDGLLFAEVDLQPTLAGKLLDTFFNPPQLRIFLHLANGKTERYRVVANMMRTTFLLSPVVENTSGFAALVSGSKSDSPGQRVESFSIEPVYGGSHFWSRSFHLTLRQYSGR